MAETNPVDEGKPVFSWKAAEFPEYKKHPTWFIIIALAGLALVVFFIWSNSWTTAGVVAAAVLAIFSSAGLAPKKVECKLFREGIVIDKRAFRYTDLKSFWIVDSEHPTVRFARPGKFTLMIEAPLGKEDAEQVRLFLSKFLPQEENRGEELTDVLNRWLRF